MMTTLVQLKSVVGKGLWQKPALGLLFLSATLSASAAPLDALLTATPEQAAPKGYLEVGSDHMNEQLDVFGIRDTNALAAGTQAGDYRGAHLAGGWALRDNIWLSGSLWQRKLNGLSETYNFTTWQVSGSYRFLEGIGKVPALAMRLSAWGNYASEVGANFPANAGVNVLFPLGTRLQTIIVSEPADNNVQADLIGTWNLSPAADLSVLLGAGSTQLSYGELTGSLVQGGTPYQLQFMGNKIVGTAADGTQIGVPASNYGIDVKKELAWRGNFLQAGLNAVWRSGPWTLRGGYLFYVVQREGVDDILAARGWSAFTQTKMIALEANYRVHPHLSAFVRSQLSSTLIFNEMPVAYNTFSADLFGGKYSVYTVGLRADF